MMSQRQTFLSTALFLLLISVSYAGPQIQHWKTDKGLAVYFVHSPEIPMVDVRLVFDAGSARDGPERPGVAKLTGFMMAQGAAGKSSDQMAAAFEDVGAVFGAGSQRDMAWLSLRTLKEGAFFDPAVNAFLDAVGKPDFPDKDFQRGLKQTKVALEAQKADPGSIASKRFFKELYGDHPYARPPLGSEESLSKITLEALKDFHQRFYVAQNGVLALVGDLTLEEAKGLASKVSNVLTEGEKAPPLPQVERLTEGKEIRIPFPSKQAHVMMGAPGIYRGHPDYFALYLGNHVLGGGGFTSRLVEEVRQKRGYAYSVYSYFMPMKQSGPFLIGMQTRGNQVDDGIAVVKETLQGFLKKGPAADEVVASKKNITGGFPLRIASNGSIVEYLGLIGFYGLPLDYLDTFVGKIESVSDEAVHSAFERHVKTDNLITIVVGGSG